MLGNDHLQSPGPWGRCVAQLQGAAVTSHSLGTGPWSAQADGSPGAVLLAALHKVAPKLHLNGLGSLLQLWILGLCFFSTLLSLPSTRV